MVVLAAGPEGDVPEQALVDLLGGPLGIGAVVPLLFDVHDRVAEGGTITGPSGTVASFNTGAALGAPEHSFRRDVAGTSSAVIAVSSEALDGFSPGTRGPDAAAVVRDVLEHVRTRGLRTVYEPSWRVPAPEGFSPLPAPVGPRRWAERDEGAPTRVLVVTGTVPGTLVGFEGLSEIVGVLSQSPATRVTLACADGFEAGRVAGYYQRQGIEVVAGPVDWPLWCDDRRYHYSHVLVSDEGLTTRLWSLVRATQPQALCVLYSERLPFRRSQALGEATEHTARHRNRGRGAACPSPARCRRSPGGLVRQRVGRQPFGWFGARDAGGSARAGTPSSRGGQGLCRPGGRGPGGHRQLRRRRGCGRARPSCPGRTGAVVAPARPQPAGAGDMRLAHSRPRSRRVESRRRGRPFGW